jgi:hypothetical protein
MDQQSDFEPYVFLTIKDKCVVVLPGKGHTAETWRETRGKIINTYIEECIDGPFRSPGGRCEGVGKVLEFFARHAEAWNCSYTQGGPISSWMLVE